MNILLAGVIIFALSIIVLSFIDLKLSVAIYISYLILVPYLKFNIAGFPLSYNLVNLILFAVFIYQSLINKRFNLNTKFIAPFLFLYFMLFYLSLFAGSMPWSIQFNGWRASLMKTCIVPFIVWNLTLSDQKFKIYFKWAFLISITIACVYGILLMRMEGLNPYISMLSDYFGTEDWALVYSALESRIDFSTASKIQSTMSHPMTWTLMLCFSFIIISAIYLKTKNKMLLILIGLVGFNIFISGVRTGIAALTIGFFYFLVRNRNFKLIIYTLIGLIVIVVVIQSNESLSNLFASFTDISGEKSDIRGSTISMRLDQLQGTVNEIKGNELAGKGYGWTGYYISEFGVHPVILAFESLIYTVLCNSGYIGAVVWIMFFLLLFQLNRKIIFKKIDIYLLDTFILTYAAYSVGTGEYEYMPFFAIFYSYLMGYFLLSEKTEALTSENNTKKINNNFIKFELTR